MSSSSKWRTVGIYAPLVKGIEKLIEEQKIMYSNASQFINAVVERAYSEELSKIENSN